MGYGLEQLVSLYYTIKMLSSFFTSCIHDIGQVTPRETDATDDPNSTGYSNSYARVFNSWYGCYQESS